MSGFKRYLCILLSVALILSQLSGILTAFSEEAPVDGADLSVGAVSDTVNTYKNYCSDNAKNSNGKSDVKIALENAPVKAVRGDALMLDFNVGQAGLYEFRMDYNCMDTQDSVIGLKIDGSAPFEEAERLSFPTYWENDGKDWKKSEGNQYTPEQKVYSEDVFSYACDYSGKEESNYKFYLSEGEHTLNLDIVQGEISIRAVSFVPPQNPDKYSKPEGKTDGNDETVIIEGEDAILKNGRSLIPMSDNSSALVHPSNATVTKLNYIGNSNWSNPGSSIMWEFEVENSGYYTLQFDYRQNQILGGVAYRSLKIDGEYPFAEAEKIKFNYGSKWQSMVFGEDKDNPYQIYLKKGKHTLTLAVTSGELAEIYSDLQDVTALMGNVYVDITKVVGETVDIYRSYELFNQIPDFNDNLDTIIKALNKIESDMNKLQGNNTSSSASIVKDSARVVKQMRDNPYSAHRYKTQYYDSYTNLCALMTDMVNMPLDIDRMIISSVGSQYKSDKPNVFKRFAFSLQRFFITFSDDYNNISDTDDSEQPLTIWINWGRDQAEALNSIIQDGFVRESGISVNVKLVNASLIQAILAGSGPDCLIQMSRTEPVNLAMRGALVDLKQFDDFDEVLNQFHEDAEVPYRYKDGVYALPVTQSFFLMFMRTDILATLDISTPGTWDDFINAAAVLQRNNLQAVIPYTELANSGTVNTGVGGLTLYPTMLIQKGLSLYNDELNSSTLTDVEQIQTFVSWSELYTKYKFQEITNFYNRFRIGSAPLGIAPYTVYTELKAAAPEIDGRWTVSVIPGTVDENGNINNSSAGSGAGCAITKLSKNPENAWKFLKWWTSASVQLKYSNTLESVLGPLGRVATANKEAFSEMDWDASMYDQIIAQYNATVEIPEIPGGYYTARGIDQAFWNVTESGKDATEMLTKWGEIVNTEIKRKIAEYS